jgi:hypothetical protein
MLPNEGDQMTAKNTVKGPSKLETRADQTTAAATEIIEKEISLRAEKTGRLRAARLKREQEDRAKVGRTPVKPSKRKATTRKPKS